jgi:hypothetical protein
MKIGHSQAEDESVNFKNELKIKHRDDKMLGGFDSEVKFDNSGKCAAESTWDGPFRVSINDNNLTYLNYSKSKEWKSHH